MTAAKPPSFKPRRFTVHLLPEGVDPAILDDPDTDVEALDLEGHRVTVLWADQVRAEAAGPQFGISSKSHAALAQLWVWCAMVRTGRTRDKFPAFRVRTIDVGDGDKLDEDGPEVAADEAANEGAAGPT